MDEEAGSFLKRAFATLFDPRTTEAEVLQFWSPDYIQDLNGKRYSFAQFMDGVLAMKGSIRSVKVDFTNVVSSGDTIAETHRVEAVKKDGTHLRFKVIAFQTIENGRIARAEEINCPLET